MRTQVLSSIPAERLPAMWGRATFAMLVSSTSMNVASVTVIATSQGLRWCSATTHFTVTVGTTETPTPISRPSGSGSSKTIFTGTRWTTFT